MKLRRISLWFVIAILTCFAYSSVQGQMLVPDGTSGATYNAAFPVTITLDGDFRDWTQIPYASVTRSTTASVNPGETSLKFAAAADADNLYISAWVTDAHIVAGTHGINYFNEDSVEIYINASGDLSLTGYIPGVAQITLPAANIGAVPGQEVVAGINFESLGVRSVTISTPTGYAIEAAIPLRTSAWNITPQNGESIGFQVDLNSASQTDRDVKLIWSDADQQDQSYQNPSVFGQLVFYQVEGQQVALAPTLTPETSGLTPTVEATVTHLPSVSEAIGNTATPAPGAGFTVEGTQIIGPNGQPFVAKGVNINGFNWTWPRAVIPDADMIIQCWNFNLVRVNSFLFTGQIPYPQYDTNNDLDAIIQTYTSRGIVVILEGHDRIGSYYMGSNLTTLINWYTDLASRYRDNPYVWFDVMNEPGSRTGIDPYNWDHTHGEVIEAIRNKANNNNIIIVEGAYGGQDAGNADANPVTDSAILKRSTEVLNFNGQSFDNIVFSIHTYDLWNYGDAKMADFFDRVQAQNLAMIVGEYGVFTDQDTQAAAQSLFNTAPPRGIGRIVWQWDGGDRNDLTNSSTGGGWEINNCQNPTNLSWLGQQVWNDNHSN